MVRAKKQSVLQTLVTTGRVRGGREASLGFDIGGVVASARAEEGDRVAAGSVLVTLRTGELEAARQLAHTALAAAQADLRQAEAKPLASERHRLEAEVRRAEAVGEARVRRAEDRLRELKAGTRPEEVAAGEAELGRVAAGHALARSEYGRAEALRAQGAIAASDLDRARARLEEAQASEAVAASRLALLRAGPRQEEIAQARADLQAAEAEWNGAGTAARLALATLLATPRPEGIAAAAERVRGSQASLEVARAQLRRAAVTAPYSGVIAEKLAEEGDAVLPGQRVIRLVELQAPEIEVETDEQNLARLRLGQKAVITAEALPGRRAEARVVSLGARSDFERGTILVKLRPLQSAAWLRADLTVDVNLLLGERELLLLPARSVRVVGGRASVLVFEGGRAVARGVTLGDSGPDGIAVLSGLAAGELVVADATVTPGSRVRARRR